VEENMRALVRLLEFKLLFFSGEKKEYTPQFSI
jgi:hypothetical protein